jgi:hypothetical protein
MPKPYPLILTLTPYFPNRYLIIIYTDDAVTNYWDQSFHDDSVNLIDIRDIMQPSGGHATILQPNNKPQKQITNNQTTNNHRSEGSKDIQIFNNNRSGSVQNFNNDRSEGISLILESAHHSSVDVCTAHLEPLSIDSNASTISGDIIACFNSGPDSSMNPDLNSIGFKSVVPPENMPVGNVPVGNIPAILSKRRKRGRKSTFSPPSNQ